MVGFRVDGHIFEGKNFNHLLSQGEIPDTVYGTSPKGWIDTELFRCWFSDHFLRHATAARPLLLLMDGHSSHYQPELVRYAKENDVVLLCLPPHTTADSQPLDVGVFGPLKTRWSQVCHQWMDEHPGRIITKFQFSELLNEAWVQAMTPKNAIAGFKKAGICPFNQSAIQVPSPDTPSNDKIDDKCEDKKGNDGNASASIIHTECASVVSPDNFTEDQFYPCH